MILPSCVKVLMVEDSAEDAELEEAEIRKSGLDVDVRRVETKPDLESALQTWKPDLVISDFSLPGMDGLAVLDIVRGLLPEVPFLFVSGTIGEERAIEAMKRGATDYVVKERLSGLVVRVKRALDEAKEHTRHRKLQEDLRHVQKMDVMGRLAGAVAHDFNNLLTVILSYGELALEKLRPGDPARADVEQIYRAGESAVSLTRQLLSFSRKIPLTLHPVEINSVVAAMMPLLSRLLGVGIDIEFKQAPTIRAVRADVGGLEQILLNLCMNSRDAMPNGGRLTIETAPAGRRTKATDFREPAGGECVVLRVSDTGTGIDAETLPRIFEPFFTTKAPGKGTGLGLSTVYGLVEAFGGSVAVVSEVGRGTTFWVYLTEVETGTWGADSTVIRPKLLRGDETILVAEDSPTILKIVSHVLGAQGYKIIEAADGLEAIKLFESHQGKIDVLLTDVVMPGLGGRELAAKLREKRKDLKVILMSGQIEGGGEDAIGPTEGIPLLGKPFTPHTLSTLVRTILDTPPRRR